MAYYRIYIALLLLLSTSTSFAFSKGEALDEILNLNPNLVINLDEKIDTNFSDLSPERQQIAERLYDLGVISYSKYQNKFFPESKLKAFPAINILFRYHGVFTPVNLDRLTEDFLTKYKVNKSAYFSKTMARAYEIGMIESPISPFSNISREQFLNWYKFLEEKNFKSSVNLTIKNVDSEYAINKAKDFQILDQIYTKIRNEYYDTSKTSDKNLIEGAAKGMVDALGDPYSEFQNALDNKDFLNNTHNNLEGIGVSINLNDENHLIINSIIPNTPASSSGLMPNDQIVRVDNISIADKSLSDALELIKGPSGSYVKLDVLRDSKIYSYTIKRAVIKIPVLESKILNNNILYLKLNKFTPNASSQIESLISQVDFTKIKSYVIDLRSNPGGYVDQTVEISDLFLGPNKTVLSLNSKSYKQDLKTKKDAIFPAKSMYVLVNRASASASEILADSLQTHYNAKLVGETTFGKGTFQDISFLKNSSALKLTIGEWSTASGVKINKTGLVPDVFIETNLEDLKSGNDPVLNYVVNQI